MSDDQATTESPTDDGLDPEYQRVLGAATEEEALRLEAAQLVETDKTSELDDPDPEELGAEVDTDAAERRQARAGQVDRVLARAIAEVGYREGRNDDNKYGRWYGMNHAPWCAMFLSWVFYHEGLPLPATISKGFARTLFGAQWFQRHGRWTTTPARGHVVFYDLSAKVDSIDHVGIVERVNGDGSIRTIEGNTSGGGSRQGNGVYAKNRRRGIVGYGAPDYQQNGSDHQQNRDVPAWPGRVLKQPPPMVGGDVRLWQQRMKERGWRKMVVDGTYDGLDERICRAFQREKRLKEDGEVGPDTWRAAWTAPVTP